MNNNILRICIGLILPNMIYSLKFSVFLLTGVWGQNTPRKPQEKNWKGFFFKAYMKKLKNLFNNFYSKIKYAYIIEQQSF